MHRITGTKRHYDWGSREALPRLLGEAPASEPVAEIWYGTHPLAPSRLLDRSGRGGAQPGLPLSHYIAQNSSQSLGAPAVSRFGEKLPYLLKLIAPARPLSLQLHPSKKQAQRYFAAEEAAGLALDSPQRFFKDANHKPELVYALSDFQALAGFRAPRRAVEIFSNLPSPLARWISETLRTEPSPRGMKQVVRGLLRGKQRPDAADIRALAAACAARLETGKSPSVRVDNGVVRLAAAYPEDPGVVIAALLNPVSLSPGDVLFVPSGAVHMYLSGVGVEIMAASDNVLRAGLTHKPIGIDQFLDCVDYAAAPPMRIAPERIGEHTEVFYAPVDDFELSVNYLTDQYQKIPGNSGRILLLVSGGAEIKDESGSLSLRPGEAVFSPLSDGELWARGTGLLMQADIP